MKSSALALNAVALVALATFNPLASATPINGTSTGLNNPSVLITFDAPPAIDMNAPVTDQYSSLGVSFDTLYYNPFDPDNQGQYTTITGKYLGNYQFTDGAEFAAPDDVPLTISFSSVQTQVAFGLQSNGGDGGNGNIFTFTAMLNGADVETYQASVADGYYGFTDSQFDSIVVTSCVPDPDDGISCSAISAPQRVARSTAAFDQGLLVNPDFYLLDNLQFGNAAVNPGVLPEPEMAALFGLGLFGAAAMRRRVRSLAA